MAREKTVRASSGGRGSKEAIEKRRAARQLNALLTGGKVSAAKSDGRTEKRRQRLIKELRDGRGGEALKPIDLVAHVNELLGMGETLASLRQQGVRARKTELTAEARETVERTQQAYGFRPEAWKMLGLEVTPDGGVSEARTRGRRASSAAE